MKGAETRLEGFIEEVGLKVGVELGSDQTFQSFGEKREIGYGTVIGKVGWVKGGFFKDGVTEASLKARGTWPRDSD